MFKKLSVLALAMIISLSITACNSKKNKANDESNTKVTTADDSKEKETLFVYSGAGLKKPMDEIAQKFEKENNVKVEYSYAGSAQLIAQIETSHKGDVFIVVWQFIQRPLKKNL